MSDPVSFIKQHVIRHVQAPTPNKLASGGLDILSRAQKYLERGTLTSPGWSTHEYDALVHPGGMLPPAEISRWLDAKTMETGKQKEKHLSSLHVTQEELFVFVRIWQVAHLRSLSAQLLFLIRDLQRSDWPIEDLKPMIEERLESLGLLGKDPS